MKIYTKTGDAGQTGLFSGERVPKSHPLVAAYGTVDELNCALGLALAASPQPDVAESLLSLQNLLFVVGADLASPPGKRDVHRVGDAEIRRIEEIIDRDSLRLPPLHAFILPGGTPAAAAVHFARSVCRRAEREAVCAAGQGEKVNPSAITLLNRVSDFLFVLSRLENFLAGKAECEWRGDISAR